MKRNVKEMELDFDAHLDRPADHWKSMVEEEDEEVVEEDSLDGETSWERAFKAGEEMANNEMVEDDWEDDEDFV